MENGADMDERPDIIFYCLNMRITTHRSQWILEEDVLIFDNFKHDLVEFAAHRCAVFADPFFIKKNINFLILKRNKNIRFFIFNDHLLIKYLVSLTFLLNLSTFNHALHRYIGPDYKSLQPIF